MHKYKNLTIECEPDAWEIKVVSHSNLALYLKRGVLQSILLSFRAVMLIYSSLTSLSVSLSLPHPPPTQKKDWDLSVLSFSDEISTAYSQGRKISLPLEPKISSSVMSSCRSSLLWPIRFGRAVWDYKILDGTSQSMKCHANARYYKIIITTFSNIGFLVWV